MYAPDAPEEHAGREPANVPHAVDNAPSLSETSSLNSKHVRRMSSIADHRAQKAQAVSKREANAVQSSDEHRIDTSNVHSRYIPWDRHDDHPHLLKFEGNAVSTAKYDRYFITFVFKFLFEMFSRVAYVYFLFQAGLSWWDEVSPFAGYGATLALTFVLLAAAIKAIIEDRKRQAEDHKTNNSMTIVMKRGDDGKCREHECRWSEVMVGDVVKVFDNDLFPADLMCVHCELPEHICYVKTTNLDGETNLKVKRQVLDAEDYPDTPDPEVVLDLLLEVECEMPNSNLHNFRGRASIKQHPGDPGKILPITMNQMLLRGCMLKNSHSILGLVVYTGKDTRIQMNSAAAPLKIGSFDHFLNMQVAILIMAQVCLCIVCAALNYNWRETEGKRRYYLDFKSYTQGNKENGVLYTLLVFITFWILYSYLVPISLFVTLEIVKFWQGFIFINSDREMRDPVSGEGARCRNSNLNEDLGKIDYIFSDKTGTLTSNEMRLRLIAIKGQPLGDLNKRLEDYGDLQGFPAIKFFSEQMHTAMQAIRNDPKAWSKTISGVGSPKDILSMKDSVSGSQGSLGGDAGYFLPHHLMDFWLNLALCHALLVDTSDGKAQYQGPSPDEVALVECARSLGFEFVSRSATHTVLNILGQEHAFETLEVMEFSSERQRMSVIVRCPDGTIKLMCKGADAMMLRRLSPDTSPDLLERVHDNLHYFATKGLRTLVIGTRIIPPNVYADWDRRFVEAQGMLADDENCEDKLMNEIESHLEVVGVTAIEDKLQDEVPESIATLIEAGIKVWMITGDKQETAINIAISCRLFQGQDNLLICNSDSRRAATARLQELTVRAAAMQDTLEPTQLVIDGKTLTHVLKDEEVERHLAKLGSLCGAVVVCRASPSQKARIVTMMREFELRLVTEPLKFGLLKRLAKQTRNLQGKMLSIGDGANDVAMIQAADVGIGIAGKEGRQAVNNSDYAITQFRFLTRLLLVHGQVSQYRLGRLIKYSFYKNSCFAGVLFYFQIFNGFSGQTLVDDISAAVYNVIFTSLPILFFSLLDQPCKFETMQRFPRTYNKSQGLSISIFWKTGVLHAFLDAAICFFIPFLAASPLADRSTIDIFSVGKTIFICMLGVVTSEIMIVARYWTAWFAAVCALSYLLVYPYVLLSPLVMQAMGLWDMENLGVGVTIMSTPFFWVALVTVYTMTFTIRYFERSLKWLFRPDDNMILAELEARQGTVSMKPAKPDPRPIYPVVEDPHAAPAGTAMAESQYTAPLVAVSPASADEGDTSASGHMYFSDASDARSRSFSGRGTQSSMQGRPAYTATGTDRPLQAMPELSM